LCYERNSNARLAEPARHFSHSKWLNNGTVIHVDTPFAIRAVPHNSTCIVFDDEGIARFIAYRNMDEVVTSDLGVNGAME
jgi:hypothetical protein